MNEKDRDFLFDLFKDWNGEWTNELEKVYYKTERRSPYETNFPRNIELTSEEIKDLLNRIYELKGNFHDNTAVKGDIVSFIFECVSDKSKCDFLRSDSFKELQKESDWHAGEFFRFYNIENFVRTVSDESFDTLFENMPRRDEAELKVSLGIIPEDLDLQTAIINFVNYPAPDTGREVELLFALQDIDVDFSEIANQDRKGKITKSDIFKTAINTYYDSLNEFEKNDFIFGLSSLKRAWGGPMWIDYNHPMLESRLQIFDAIEDDSKYSYAGLNVLAGLLEYNFIEDDSKRLDTILLMYEKNSRDPYVYDYFLRVQNGKFDKIDVPFERFSELIEQISEFDDKLFIMGIIDTVPTDTIKEYLSTKPEKISLCMNALTYEEANEFLATFDDEFYKARLILSIQTDGVSLAKLFPHIEDEYVRAQLTVSKHTDERFVSVEDTEEKIANFLKLKEEFLKLPEEERADFLCNLPTSEEKRVYRENNEIKKSLLKHIENSEDRQKVIESMERYVSPDMLEYANLAERMFREYMEDNFELTPAQKEKFEMVLRNNDVFFTTYESSGTTGQCQHVEKNITLTERSRGNTKNIIVDLLHEYSHAISMSEFLQSSYTIGKTFEEGMADTFAEQVANHYFTKHSEVTLYEEEFKPELPLISQSSYLYQNGWVKSMLYPLEETNQDKKAMQEFLFGDKKVFLDMSFGEGYSQEIEQDYMGNPLNPPEDADRLLETHIEAFRTRRSESLYLKKNDRIPYLFTEAIDRRGFKSMKERIETESIIFGEVAGANYALSLDLNEMGQAKEEQER